MCEEKYCVVEICAGAGGQALGLEQAGYHHVCLVEIENAACNTLKHNRPNWEVIELDVREFSAAKINGVDLLAGGVPCPPFSIAGKQKGQDDERDLFPEMIRLASECNPKAIMIENVRGILSAKFNRYRNEIEDSFENLGYRGMWKLVQSSDYGVSQSRPRAIFIAFRDDHIDYFQWPEKFKTAPPTVGELLYQEMMSNGWEKAKSWKEMANGIAPTLVGGSKKHGGPDLGPTRSRKAWARLGVNGSSLANDPPSPNFEGTPRLTVEMAALVQGFPPNWKFTGKKTAAYRQVGNAFPPPVAKEIGKRIIAALKKETKNKWEHIRSKVLELNFESTS